MFASEKVRKIFLRPLLCKYQPRRQSPQLIESLLAYFEPKKPIITIL